MLRIRVNRISINVKLNRMIRKNVNTFFCYSLAKKIRFFVITFFQFFENITIRGCFHFISISVCVRISKISKSQRARDSENPALKGNEAKMFFPVSFGVIINTKKTNEIFGA